MITQLLRANGSARSRLHGQITRSRSRSWASRSATTDFLDRYVKGQPAALARLQQDSNMPRVASLQAAP